MSIRDLVQDPLEASVQKMPNKLIWKNSPPEGFEKARNAHNFPNKMKETSLHIGTLTLYSPFSLKQYQFSKGVLRELVGITFQIWKQWRYLCLRVILALVLD